MNVHTLELQAEGKVAKEASFALFGSRHPPLLLTEYSEWFVLEDYSHSDSTIVILRSPLGSPSWPWYTSYIGAFTLSRLSLVRGAQDHPEKLAVEAILSITW